MLTDHIPLPEGGVVLIRSKPEPEPERTRWQILHVRAGQTTDTGRVLDTVDKHWDALAMHDELNARLAVVERLSC